MALVAANVGELVLIGWMLKDESVTADIHLHLYKNNYTPLATSTVASFTECDFTDYALVALERSSWGTATTVSGKAQLEYADQEWTAGTAQDVYGYYVTTADNATLLWAEKFDTVRSLLVGSTLTVTPRITLNSEN